MRKLRMNTLLVPLLLLPWPFDSGSAAVRWEPDYASPATRAIIEAMLVAHGGVEAWERVDTVRFRFFTKLMGIPNSGWLSIEITHVESGHAVLEWPAWSATSGWDGSSAWSVNWPEGLPPPGFFTRLTYSFIALPWLTQDDRVHLSVPGTGRLPEDDLEYVTVRMTRDDRGPSIPGDYYDLYIHPESKRLAAIQFNITHPGLMRIPGQAVGPITHVFSEYAEVEGIIFPTYYVTYGRDLQRNAHTAVHAIFDLQINLPFDEHRAQPPAGAIIDQQTLDWWRMDRSR